MKTLSRACLGLALAASALPATAFAQNEAPSDPITISGSVTLVSDYRFRGFTQNSEDPAIQGGITVTHESGFYVGTWGSSVSFAGNTEVDLFAGYSKDVGGVTIDGGLLYYLYPQHGGSGADFFEPYLNLSTDVGPVNAKVGVNYAWKQSALGNLQDPSRAPGAKSSAFYLHGELAADIPGTPLALNAHAGQAWSDAFPGGFDGKVFDWSVGATASYKMLTFGVSYVNTDEPKAGGYKDAIGADGAVVFSLGASF
ncbi:TorF family putative porin [Sphingopyxis sp. NFH-91]|uniref:TorF family putative porin n=1 Tax=Sphingopyxis sp. NFH-91 TaxID=2744457 RepID=UPI001F43F1D6|nr:TorF family putative porin [Sphingopyxis sp. NFH-91]